MNQRGPSKAAIIHTESSDGWIYELYKSGEQFRIYLINPEGRRFENLRFYVEDGRVKNLQDSMMPDDFQKIFFDREEFSDNFIQKAFRVARIHEVIES